MDPQDLVGRTIGRLYVEAVEQAAGMYSIYRCVCACGAVVKKSRKYFIAKNTNPSCGCLLREHRQRLSKDWAAYKAQKAEDKL